MQLSRARERGEGEEPGCRAGEGAFASCYRNPFATSFKIGSISTCLMLDDGARRQTTFAEELLFRLRGMGGLRTFGKELLSFSRFAHKEIYVHW